MGLDFTGLGQIAAGFTGAGETLAGGAEKQPPPEKQAHILAADGRLRETEGNNTPERQNAVEGHLNAPAGMGTLQRQADQAQRDKENTLAIYQRYQQAANQSAALRTEILRGVKAGESIYSLFLKAVKAVSLMSNNRLFYDQIAGELPTIYGKGLLEPEPLELELTAVKERLERLQQAETRAQNAQELAQIQAAIRAHRGQIESLETLISEAHT